MRYSMMSKMVDMSCLFRAVCTEMYISIHNKDLLFLLVARHIKADGPSNN